MKIETVRKASKGSPALHLLKNEEGVIIGMLEKYRNTRTEQHPWKAFLGVGERTAYLGAFYNLTNFDGKQEAINLIARQHDARQAA